MQHILKKYLKTGVISHLSKYQGTYMDFPDAPTFHEAQNIIADTKTMFETVPAVIRADFDNDPSKYLEFLQNPENKLKIEAYGLSTSHFPPEAETCEPIPTPAPEPKSAPSA